MFFGHWTKPHRLVKGGNPPGLHRLLLQTSQQTCEAPYRSNPMRNGLKLNHNDKDVTQYLRMENAHLWLQTGAEQSLP